MTYLSSTRKRTNKAIIDGAQCNHRAAVIAISQQLYSRSPCPSLNQSFSRMSAFGHGKAKTKCASYLLSPLTVDRQNPRIVIEKWEPAGDREHRTLQMHSTSISVGGHCRANKTLWTKLCLGFDNERPVWKARNNSPAGTASEERCHRNIPLISFEVSPRAVSFCDMLFMNNVVHNEECH